MNKSFKKREEIIPIINEKCQKILLLGTTGAGKTTLLRHLIGVENFPATSTSRTTIHDIEILSKKNNGFYEAVVTFMSEKETKNYIEECVSDAIAQYIKTEDEDKMMKHFLFHQNMKFRLGYILGKLHEIEKQEDKIDDLGFDFEEDEENTNEKKEEKTSFVKSEKIQNRLKSIKNKLIELSEEIKNKIAEGLSIDIKIILEDNTKDYFEQHEKAINKSENFENFTNEILSEIKNTFEYICKGDTHETNNWFDYWTFKTSDRELFFKTINLFSSNNANDFGKLLTPLVSGIRVFGNFLPNYHRPDEFYDFVFIDGEGLGHNIETASNLSENITSKFSFIDKILLIDNAEQPMRAASITVLKNATVYGIQKKLLLAFTHFDQVKGDNFATEQDKKDHIDFTINNVLNEILKENHGNQYQKSLEETINNNKFYLSNIQKKKLKKISGLELRKLVKELAYKNLDIKKIENPQITFNSYSLDDYLVESVNIFRETWNDFLGFSYQAKYKKVHSATLKEFTKRITWGQKEYSNLHPIQDLTFNLNKSIGMFLDSAILHHEIFKEEEIINTFDEIKKSLGEILPDEISKIVIENEEDMWEDAYYFTGTGSSRKRAFTIQKIYDKTTFEYKKNIREQKNSKFLLLIRTIVEQTIEKNNCNLTER